jgi:plastocyanin
MSRRDLAGSKWVNEVVITAAVGLALAGLATQTSGAEVYRFELRIENGRLSNNLRTIRVQQGDFVEIGWSSDRHVVLHLHGYDMEVTVDSGKNQRLTFRAHASGRFPIEIHGERHKVLLYLEVYPR